MSVRILSGEVAIVNQLRPSKNPWAWDLFLKGQANNWVPTEVPMSKDIEQWKSRDILTDDERLLLRRCLGFFAGTESLVSNNLLLAIFRAISDGECRQYILRQAFEESLHNQTIVYICDSLGLNNEEIYGAHQNIPAIKAKDDFLMSVTTDMYRPDFNLGTIAGRVEALKNIIIYYLVCEGTLFYSGFAMLLSFGRQNKMPGVCEQIQYTLRDESIHLQFGTQLVNLIIQQEPDLWTGNLKKEVRGWFEKATELEIQYARDVLPRGVLGLRADLFVDYMHYIANRRLENIGLPKLVKSARNPFPWMTEVIDLPKQKNFFETRVTEYSVGQLLDDL